MTWAGSRGVVFVALGCATCGPKPSAEQPSWLEHDARGTTHATAAPRGTPTPAAIDPAKLDPARLDDYDEATIRAALEVAGDRAPAGKLALRAARIAHHRGDDREARDLIARARGAADEPEVHAALEALGGELVTSTV